jgi:hypothetical protein
MTGQPRGAALLTVRAWVEDHPSTPLRAVVTSYADIEVGARVADVTASVASVDEVCRLVREWLERSVVGPGPVSPPTKAPTRRATKRGT